MSLFTNFNFRQVCSAWLGAWDVRRVAACGLLMSGVTLAAGGAAALARAADPLLMPFAGLAGFFVWLWWFSLCVAMEMQGGRLSSFRFPTDRFADGRAAIAWKFAIPAFLAMLAIAAGGLHAIFPSALGMLVLFPLQWAGAWLLLLTLPAAFAATAALRLAPKIPEIRGLGDLTAWSLRENPPVWVLLAHLALMFAVGSRALDLVLWMQPKIFHLWPYTLWGSSFGQAPPEGHASVAALHLGILLALLPLQGHLVVFAARLGNAAHLSANP